MTRPVAALVLLMLLLLLLLLGMNRAPTGTEDFTDGSVGAEKVKTVLSYFRVTGQRSPAGMWTQADAQALQAARGLIGQAPTPMQSYYAAAFLKRAAGGATAEKFLAGLDPAEARVLRATAAYNDGSVGMA